MKTIYTFALVFSLFGYEAHTEVYWLHIDCDTKDLQNEATKNIISVSLWEGTRMISTTASNYYGMGYKSGPPRCNETFEGTNYSLSWETGDNPTHVILQTSGSDGFFIDRMWIERSKVGKYFKENEEFNSWGDQDGNGWCLSTDPNDANGSWKGRLAMSQCFSAIKLDLKEKNKWEPSQIYPEAYADVRYKIFVDCFASDMENESTKNNIMVRCYNGNTLLSEMQLGGSPCNAFDGPTVEFEGKVNSFTHFVISTNGDDGFWVDRIMAKVVYDTSENILDYDDVRDFGQQGGKGWCFSTDPTDANRSWKGKVEGCWRNVKFEIDSGRAYGYN